MARKGSPKRRRRRKEDVSPEEEGLGEWREAALCAHTNHRPAFQALG